MHFSIIIIMNNCRGDLSGISAITTTLLCNQGKWHFRYRTCHCKDTFIQSCRKGKLYCLYCIRMCCDSLCTCRSAYNPDEFQGNHLWPSTWPALLKHECTIIRSLDPDSETNSVQVTLSFFKPSGWSRSICDAVHMCIPSLHSEPTYMGFFHASFAVGFLVSQGAFRHNIGATAEAYVWSRAPCGKSTKHSVTWDRDRTDNDFLFRATNAMACSENFIQRMQAMIVKLGYDCSYLWIRIDIDAWILDLCLLKISLTGLITSFFVSLGAT